MRRFVFLVLLLCLVASITGCSKQSNTTSSSTTDVKLAILAPGASDFWKIVEAGADKAAEELGVSCEVIAPSQPGATEQKTRLEDLIARGVDGIAFAPVDPNNQIAAIDKAASQTNLITTDTDAPKSKRLCYVGTDNYAAGKLAGEELKKALPNGGKVWVCVGMLDAQNAHDRYQGVVDAVKGTKINILGVLTDNADRTKAKANVEDQLVKTPDIAAFVGLWSYNGPAILDALIAAKKIGKVKIICFDEDAATIEAVKKGSIEATVVQNPFEFGYQSVKVLTALAKKEDAGIPESKVIDTGARVINKSNVGEFEAEFKKMVGK
ncbi:MAG TPA: sugar-binding protein [Armatimonadota bacterium]|nr:sugar-binding protein [Armatimonadota bacterium]